MAQESQGYLENALCAMAQAVWAPNALRAMAAGAVFWANAKHATAQEWFSNMTRGTSVINLTAINTLVFKNRTHNLFAKLVSK